jgi:hypothetical protein
MIDNAENRWHLYVSVEELSEAMMLGDQTEMVVSQRRDVSHNHKEGRPAVAVMPKGDLRLAAGFPAV